MPSYDGKPKHSVPSRRYDIFIKAFEKQVHEAQKAIAKMDKLMRPYEIVREMLEVAKIKNIHQLELKPYGVFVIIVPTDDDSQGAFDPLLKAIGSNLVKAGLHTTGEWATDHFGIDWNFEWRLMAMEEAPTVRVTINVPFGGTKFIKVTSEKRIEENTSYKSEWLKDSD